MKYIRLILIGVTCLFWGVLARAQDQKPAEPPPARTTPAYQIDIDYSQTPELKEWVDTQLRPALEEWYPRILEILPSEGFTPPQRFTVMIEANGKGIASASGTRVTVSDLWIKQQTARGPQNEALGSLIHEAVHIAQQYGRAGRRNNFPGWLTEGIADYIRWWKFEPASARRTISPVKRNGQPISYTDSYHTTAAFLEYVARNHDHEIVVKLNAAGRNGAYSPELWKKYTGKSIDELWAAFVETLKK